MSQTILEMKTEPHDIQSNSKQSDETTCNPVVKSKRKVKADQGTKTIQKPSPCKNCDKKFSERAMQIVHGYDCPKTASLQVNITGNVTAATDLTNTESDNQSKCEQADANICDPSAKSKRKELVNNHKTKVIENSYPCNKCGKKFSDKGGVMVHGWICLPSDSKTIENFRDRMELINSEPIKHSICKESEIKNEAIEMTEIKLEVDNDIFEKELSESMSKGEGVANIIGGINQSSVMPDLVKITSKTLVKEQPLMHLVVSTNKSNKRKNILADFAVNDNQNFNTARCAKRFKDAENLEPSQAYEKHAFHKIEKTVTKAGPIEKPFPCNKCDKRFSDEDMLNVHGYVCPKSTQPVGVKVKTVSTIKPKTDISCSVPDNKSKHEKPKIEKAKKRNGKNGQGRAKKKTKTGKSTNKKNHYNESSLEDRPPYTYNQLIAQAINNSPNRNPSPAEIMKYIIEKYPYYKKPGHRHSLLYLE